MYEQSYLLLQGFINDAMLPLFHGILQHQSMFSGEPESLPLFRHELLIKGTIVSLMFFRFVEDQPI